MESAEIGSIMLQQTLMGKHNVAARYTFGHTTAPLLSFWSRSYSSKTLLEHCLRPVPMRVRRPQRPARKAFY